MTNARRKAIITPKAAAYLFGVSDARMRDLAGSKRLDFRLLSGLSPRPMRAYLLEACIERWGEPDRDRLALLRESRIVQITSGGGIEWILYSPVLYVENAAGDLAIE